MIANIKLDEDCTVPLNRRTENTDSALIDSITLNEILFNKNCITNFHSFV